jgi:uncharacterized membrane protein
MNVVKSDPTASRSRQDSRRWACLAGLLWGLGVFLGPAFIIGKTPIGLAEGMGLFLLLGGLWAVRTPQRAEAVVARVEDFWVRSDGVAWLIGVGVMTHAITLILRHWAFETQAFDLRLHEELIRNSAVGRLLYSDLLGQTFLDHHVVPLFVLLVPFYWVWPSPYLLFVLQSIGIGGSAWMIWRLAVVRGVRPFWAGLTVFIFLTYRGVLTGFYLGFNQEVVAIFFLLGFLVAEATGAYRRAWIWALLSLTCREDIAVFLAVAGLLMLGRSGPSRRWGAVITVTALLWAVICYGVILPAHSSAGLMAEIHRWSAWGATPGAVVAGWLTHPWVVVKRMIAWPALKHFALLAFLPLIDLRTVAVIVLPWLVNTTSAFALQARMGGAYMALFVPWLMDGWIRQWGRVWVQRAVGTPRRLILVAMLLGIINLRNPPHPRFPVGWRAAHAALKTIRANGREDILLAQGCLLPHVGWPRSAALLGAPGTPTPTAGFTRVLLAPELNPWPLRREDIERIDADLARNPAWQRQVAGPLVIWQQIAYELGAADGKAL